MDAVVLPKADSEGRALGYASFYARKALPDGSPPAKSR